MATPSRSNIPPLSCLLTLLLVAVQFPPLLHASDEEYTPFESYPLRDEHISESCSTSADGWSTTYSQNLEQLFRTLVATVPSTGFSNTSVGESPNTVYGLSLCRGDLPAEECGNCVRTAAEMGKNDCPTKRSAMVWFGTTCFVRFSGTRFFGTVDRTWAAWALNISTTASADVAAQALAYTLIVETEQNPNMFHKKIVPRDGYTSYGMAQCTRDLTKDDCTNCLSRSMDVIKKRNYTLGRPWQYVSSSCYIRYDTRPFFQTSSAPALAPLSPSASAPLSPSASRPPAHAALKYPPAGTTISGKQRKTAIIIGSTVGVFLLAIGFFVLLFRSRKREELNEELRRYSNEMASLANLTEDERNYELPQYSLKAVQVATSNFSDDNKLGRGGFGPVYKGELNGRIVAVKRLSERSGQGLKEFMNEVVLIAKLQHKNLVRLLGCCVERGEKMLIYEFMSNGSLDTFINDPQKRKLLNWDKRFNIIMGSAKGILYLHVDSRLNIIHRDLKAGNVLLDEQMAAKISDFGMARIFSGENNPKATNLIVGTHGYMAPEYAIDGQFSIKSDVYSFGVLLLEIVSGQTYGEFHLSKMGYSLTGYAWTLWHKGCMSDFIDPLLGESAPASQILRCFHIGLLCVQEDPAIRPTMAAIIHMLESDLPTLPTPQQPPLVFRSSISNSSTSLTNSTNNSSISGSTNSQSLCKSMPSDR